MLKRLLIVFFLLVTIIPAEAENVIVIDSECIKLENIFPDIGIDEDVFCGLDYGEEKVINRQMAMYIINKYDIKGARPGEATFRRSGVLLTEDRLRSDIESLLGLMYGEVDVEVGNIRMNRDFYISPDMKYDIDIPQNRFGNVPIHVDNGNKKYSYTVSLRAFKEIYVTTSSIRKGESIKGKVSLFRVDLSKVRGEVIDSPDGLIATRNIGTNRPVTTNYVMKRPDAFEGTSVLIIYKSGGLSVSTTGELLDDAYLGKNVRVKNTASGKIVRGVYSENRKVIINN
jgi:flagella basal body P-ring formation protein FlgA